MDGAGRRETGAGTAAATATTGGGTAPATATTGAAGTGFDREEAERDLASVYAPLDEATTLPGRYYHDPAVHREEVRRIFTEMWLCAGRADDIAKAGDFVTRTIGTESVVLVRDAAGKAHAFNNVCRHRGARIVDRERGSGLGSFQCPYHSWTYDLDGALRGAPHMDEVRGFDRAQYPLRPVRLASWSGFLFVSLSAATPPLETHLAEMAHYFDRYRIDTLRCGHRMRYSVAANWKLLCENYAECYHCFLVHPQLNRVSHYRSGQIELINGATVGGYMELREPEYNTMSDSGRTARRSFASIAPEDHRRIHYYIVHPNLFLSLHPDYVMTHTLWPDGPDRTAIECEFLFDPEEMARPGFDPSDAVSFWDDTNRQDWSVCERTHLGTASSSYDRGRLSRLEWMTHIFDKFVADRLLGRA